MCRECHIAFDKPKPSTIKMPFTVLLTEEQIKKLDGDSKEIECSKCEGVFRWENGEGEDNVEELDCDKRCQKPDEKPSNSVQEHDFVVNAPNHYKSQREDPMCLCWNYADNSCVSDGHVPVGHKLVAN